MKPTCTMNELYVAYPITDFLIPLSKPANNNVTMRWTHDLILSIENNKVLSDLIYGSDATVQHRERA